MKRAAATAAAAAAALGAFSSISLVTADCPANPNSYQKTDSTDVAHTECVVGNPKAPRRETCDTHYTIITDEETGRDCYAQYDEGTGDLMCGDDPCWVDDVGCNPEKHGILPYETQDEENRALECGQKCHESNDVPLNSVIAKDKRERQREAAVADGDEAKDNIRRGVRGLQVHDQSMDISRTTTMKNLVLPLRWSNHRTRKVPSVRDIEILFNAKGGDPNLAPTGSVRDCFYANSHGRFELESKVCNWCDVPKTEAYYGDGNFGLSGLMGEAIQHCLDVCQHQYDFKMFDVDEDNMMDAIAILHSGYGAEWGEPDCDGATYEQRIWSHKWEMNTEWVGKAGVKVWSYHISPAMWGICDSTIGRIGVICHETGHFLGLADLYDGTDGNGLGTSCLMGNSWGYDGSQYYPPLMSAWSKVRLGWAEPSIINKSGTYSLQSISANKKIYAIVNPDNAKEYYLLENKQPAKQFDAHLPQPGLFIYHIDDSAAYDAEGFPGEEEWPEDHYRTALVQPDGKYHLEKMQNLGDAGDCFHKSGMNYFGPDGVKGYDLEQNYVTHKQPSTHWYGTGSFVDAGFKIVDISEPMPTMTFRVEFAGGAQRAAPTPKPTPAPVLVSNTNKVDFGGAGSETGGSKQCVTKGGKCSKPADCCTVPKTKCKKGKCVPAKDKSGGKKGNKKNKKGNKKLRRLMRERLREMHSTKD